MRFFIPAVLVAWIAFLVLAPVKLVALAYLAMFAIFLELVHQAPTIGEDEDA